MSEELAHDLDSDESSMQVLRSATDAPRPKTHAPRSVFDWRPGETAALAPRPEAVDARVYARVDGRKNPNRTKPSYQQLMCKAMVARDDGWAFEQLQAAMPDLTKAQVRNTLFWAKGNNRIELVGKLYFLTEEGLAHAASVPAGRVQATKVAASKVAPRLEPITAPGQWPLITVTVQPARFAAYSDGGFLIEKNGLQISLSAEETRAMRTYQEQQS